MSRLNSDKAEKNLHSGKERANGPVSPGRQAGRRVVTSEAWPPTSGMGASRGDLPARHNAGAGVDVQALSLTEPGVEQPRRMRLRQSGRAANQRHRVFHLGAHFYGLLNLNDIAGRLAYEPFIVVEDAEGWFWRFWIGSQSRGFCAEFKRTIGRILLTGGPPLPTENVEPLPPLTTLTLAALTV